MPARAPSALKAPFPAFGGKSRVAPLVWDRLGDVDNFIEPFCRTCATLLLRPHPPRVETVNDWDCYVANFWRATKHEPDLVAEHADNPVNEADLHARHRWLVLGQYAAEFRERMRTDPLYYDPVVAGWWVWGSCCWIGSGWCVEPKSGELSQQLPQMDAAGRLVVSGPRHGSLWEGKRPRLHGGDGPDPPGVCSGMVALNQTLPQSLPMIGASWRQNSAVPECSKIGAGNRPQLADAYSRGRGVNGNDAAGTCEQRRAWLVDWMRRLRDRLRTVRVCCGDWQRVCDSPSTTTRLGLTGIFLDPPYRTELADGSANRSGDLYASDRDSDVNALVDRVIAYCIARGGDGQIRIAVCCYEGEGYEVLADHGWTVEAWKAGGGYGNKSGQVNQNASRERIWFSPHCRPPLQRSLFGTSRGESERDRADCFCAA